MRFHRRHLLLACLLFFPFFSSREAQGPAATSGMKAIDEPEWLAAPVRATHAMVVSDDGLANAAGIEILKRGGNAVDSAVAVAFTLAVVEPEAGNIGGGGFMLVRLRDGRAAFVDYREVAPQGATRGMYVTPSGAPDSDASTAGYRAVAVPGTIAGLALALEKFGTLPLADVMAPAIRLAENGFPVSPRLAARLEEQRLKLERFPISKRIFLKGGAGYKAGEMFRQPELAATLRRIAEKGPQEFYRYETAGRLAAEMAQHDGLITRDDLANYAPKIREPLRAQYRARRHTWEVITSPPPSSGGVALIEALNILGPIRLKGWKDASSVHWVAEAMRRVFADRAAWLADSDFARVPVKGLTDPRYAAGVRATIPRARASSSREAGAGIPIPFDSADRGPAAGALPASPRTRAAMERFAFREAQREGHTTHFSVVDAEGNAVANTFTLNDSFGSGVASPDGFLLNDTMDDFTAYPGQPNLYGLLQAEANTIAPGKRALSSMTPTILLRDGRLSFVTGSPGGPRIISATLLSVLNWMRLGMGAQQAVNAPRFHHQWMPDLLVLEPGFPGNTARELERRGYTLGPSRWIGQVEAIGIDPKTGERLGAPDARNTGAAAGY